jgi:hypothetical protein
MIYDHSRDCYYEDSSLYEPSPSIPQQAQQHPQIVFLIQPVFIQQPQPWWQPILADALTEACKHLLVDGVKMFARLAMTEPRALPAPRRKRRSTKRIARCR